MEFNYKPILIVIEGPDGSGKSTHARVAVEHLRANGYDARVFRHTKPDTTDVVEAARDYARQRLALVESLRDGDVVVADRWTDSTRATAWEIGLDDEATFHALDRIADEEYGNRTLRPSFQMNLSAPAAVLDARILARGETLPEGRMQSRSFYSVEAFVDTSVDFALKLGPSLVLWAVQGLRMGAL